MMRGGVSDPVHCGNGCLDHEKWEIGRNAARLRHFRGVAAVVMSDALRVWEEVWDSFRDLRDPDAILEGGSEPLGRLNCGDWDSVRDKLHLLGHYIHYTKRLCEGTLGDPEEKERKE